MQQLLHECSERRQKATVLHTKKARKDKLRAAAQTVCASAADSANFASLRASLPEDMGQLTPAEEKTYTRLCEQLHTKAAKEAARREAAAARTRKATERALEKQQAATAKVQKAAEREQAKSCLLYTSPSPRDATLSRMPSSA